MAIRDRWNRLIRRSGSSTSTLDSKKLSKTFSWRSSKASTSTAATSITSSYSDRRLRSSSCSSHRKAEADVVSTQPGAIGSNTAKSSASRFGNKTNHPSTHQSQPCRKMRTLDDNSSINLPDDTVLRYSDMSESQRHQARLNAFTIQFGATRPRRLSMEEISPCNTRSLDLVMGP